MKLFLLETFNDPSLDCADGFVIRAFSAKSAREIAAVHCGDEGKDVWREQASSSCRALTPDGMQGIAGVVLCASNAG